MAREKEKKKRSRAAVILWSFTGVVLLLLGAFAVLFYAFPEELEKNPNLTLVKDVHDLISGTVDQGKAELERIIDLGMSTADRKGEKPISRRQDFQGERSHLVQAGESLWGIAKMGELVTNPWEWRTILLQNADKIDYAFISAEDISEGKGAWKVMLPVGQELIVTQPSLPELRGKMKGRKWLIQLAAVREARVNKAISVVRTLMGDGYYANLERFEQGDKVWYRIRSGFYDSEEAARETAGKILERYLEKNLFPPKPLVFRTSKEEKSGDSMVFGAQLANPWAIEFAKRNSHREALRDLRKVKGSGNLAYIWQTFNAPDGPYAYQVRIGFFGTEKAATAFFAKKKEGVWKDARSIRVDSLVETLPGQPHNLGEISF